ncbi:MAG: hypothetical protein ABR551_07345 [Gemmatimonadales bacterium]
MTSRGGALACLLLAAAPAAGVAQSMSVTGSVDLISPDSVAYDVGASLPGSFTLMVTGCSGTLGCRVSIENPVAASPVPITLQWRLTQVNQVGTGTLGCEVMSPLLSWQDLSLTPVPVMDTGAISELDTGCAATLEVRAVNLDYTAHQYTTPSTTYWRDILFRTVNK